MGGCCSKAAPLVNLLTAKHNNNQRVYCKFKAIDVQPFNGLIIRFETVQPAALSAAASGNNLLPLVAALSAASTASDTECCRNSLRH
jgi:hypothetical protein